MTTGTVVGMQHTGGRVCAWVGAAGDVNTVLMPSAATATNFET